MICCRTSAQVVRGLMTALQSSKMRKGVVHLVLVRRNGESGPELPDVPHPGSVVARHRHKDVPVRRVPAATNRKSPPRLHVQAVALFDTR